MWLYSCCSWLQPDRAVDPEASELAIPDEPVKTGVSSSFTIRTKDQDGKLVFVEGMKVSSLASYLQDGSFVFIVVLIAMRCQLLYSGC